MLDKEAIGFIKSSIMAGVATLTRDLREIRQLQSSPKNVGKFAVSSYRKAFWQIKSGLADKISPAYAVKYPKICDVYSSGKVFRIETDSFLITKSDPKDESMQDNAESLAPEFFVINPLSSVVNFSRSIPMFSTSVAASGQDEHGVSQLKFGCVYDLISDTFQTSVVGNGSFINDVKVRVTSQDSLSLGFVATSGLESFVRNNPHSLNNALDRRRILNMKNLSLTCGGYISMNNPELAICYVASGKVDVAICTDVPDLLGIQAALLIAKEAGARVVDFNGHDIDIHKNDKFNTKTGIIVCNYLIKDKVVDAINAQ